MTINVFWFLSISIHRAIEVQNTMTKYDILQMRQFYLWWKDKAFA